MHGAGGRGSLALCGEGECSWDRGTLGHMPEAILAYFPVLLWLSGNRPYVSTQSHWRSRSQGPGSSHPGLTGRIPAEDIAQQWCHLMLLLLVIRQDSWPADSLFLPEADKLAKCRTHSSIIKRLYGS